MTIKQWRKKWSLQREKNWWPEPYD